MKMLFPILLIGYLMISSLLVQTPPQAFKYQAVCRDANGNSLPNQAVQFRIDIMQGSLSGPQLYSEYQLDTTNSYGVSNLEIGRGQAITGSFSSINWGNGPHYISLSFDPAGGTNFIPLGTLELLSVPYALYAGSSNTQGPQGPQGVSITNSWVQGDSLFVTLSNSQTINTGHVRGATGATGATGAQGPSGPGFMNGSIQNQLMYWDGANWVTLNPGYDGQVLTLCSGILTWTTGGICPWKVGMIHCGAPTVIIPVLNPITNRTWMDRNLGASQVATNSADASSYEDLFQWGRFADGHQCRNSTTTATISITDTPGNGHYILTSISPYDWRSPANDNLWQGVNGINNPCPNGYRLPTLAEFDSERLS